MKSETEISMNYLQVLTMTEEMENCGKKFKEAAYDEINDILNAMGNSWKGEGAELFSSKVRNSIANAQNIGNYIIYAAEQIRINAQKVYQAEMEAIRIARERNN